MTREELERELQRRDGKDVVKVRNLLREKGILSGYPVPFVRKELGIALLTGEITREEALRRLLQERPGDEKLRAWVAAQGIPTQNGHHPGTNGRYPEPASVEDPRLHPNWSALVAAARAMGIDLPTALDTVSQKARQELDSLRDRIRELEDQVARGGIPRHQDPNGWGVDPDYIPGPAALRARRLIQQNKPVYLVGPAGSGKSMALRWACQQEQRRMVFVSMHGHVMGDVLEGYSWLTVRDGKTVQEWCEGVIERALRLGAVLIVDEFDRAPEAVQHLLNDVLQSRSFTLKEGPRAGETVHAAPGFLVCATGNTLDGSTGEYSATSLDRSTLSRFRVLYVDYDTRAEKELLSRLGIEGPVASRILDSFARARELYKKGDLPVALGTRHLRKVAEDIRDGFTPQEAWEMNCALVQGDPSSRAYQQAMALFY